MKDNKINNTNSFFYIWTLLTANLKFFLPVAVLDEVVLFVYALKNYKKIDLKFDIYSVMLLWSFFIGLVGLYNVGLIHNNINVIRYAAIPFFLFIVYNSPKHYLNSKYILYAAFFYLVLNIAIPIFGFIFDLQYFWWRDTVTFWFGSTYNALSIYFSAVVLLVFKPRFLLVLFVFILLYLSAVFYGSRLMLLLLGSLMVVFSLKKYTNLKSFINVLSIIILTFSFMYFFDKNRASITNNAVESNFAQLGSIESIISSEESDWDRKDYYRSIVNLFHKDKVHFLFGHGMLSHQYDLKNYASHRLKKMMVLPDGRLRSETGISSIIFDGGLVWFILILVSVIVALWQMFKIRKNTPLHIMLLCLSIPGLALFLIPIVDVIDSVWWWLALMPKGLGYLVLKEYHNMQKQ